MPVHGARGGDTLWVDGNVDGYGAIFTHKSHLKGYFRNPGCAECHDEEPVFADGHRIGDSANDPACIGCHHMNLPGDKNTACSVCHRDMYSPTDVFSHSWHTSPAGANLNCYNCHPENQPKSVENGKQCSYCHDDLIPEGSDIEFTTYQAMGYVRAMHRLCIGCHNMKVEINENPDLARCVYCHPGTKEFVNATDIVVRSRQNAGKRVIVPMLK